MKNVVGNKRLAKAAFAWAAGLTMGLLTMPVARADVPQSEMTALTYLLYDAGGPNIVITTVCGNPAYPVACDSTNSHIVNINLNAYSVPPATPATPHTLITDLSAFTQLQNFSAYNLGLTGSIPALSGLSQLQNFNVEGNKLTGSIPPLSGLSQLRYFDASSNQLTGSIPSLNTLSILQSFNVDTNQLTGAIPTLSGLTKLSTFDVGNNQLTSSMPALSGLAALQVFNTSNNQLSGPIPSLDGTDLEQFYVNNNQLTGSLPALGGLKFLGQFDAHANRLTGPIPSLNTTNSVANQLGYFDVSGNQLTGSIPELGELVNLSTFNVSSNRLTGQIPLLSGLSQVITLFDASHNLLTGSIPTLNGVVGNFEYFKVSGNALSGTLPANAFPSASDVRLSENAFTGAVPQAPPGLFAASVVPNDHSLLCPNLFDPAASPESANDQAWDKATGATPWSTACGGQYKPTTTALTFSVPTVFAGQSVTAIIVMNNGGPTTGTVAVVDSIDATATCQATLTSNGTGTCPLSFTTPGAHAVTAVYPGSAIGAPSSGTATETVMVLSAPTVALAFNPANVAAGGTTILTATLSNPNAVALEPDPNAVTIAGLPGGSSPAPNLQTMINNGTATFACGGNTASLAMPAQSGTTPGVCTITIANISVGTTPGNYTAIWPPGVQYKDPVSGATVSVPSGTTAGLTVGSATNPTLTAPTITLAFNPASIAPNATTTLTVTLTNPNADGVQLNSAITITGLPSALGNQTGTCGSPPIVMPANGSCTLVFPVNGGGTAGTFTAIWPANVQFVDVTNENIAVSTSTSSSAVLTVGATQPSAGSVSAAPALNLWGLLALAGLCAAAAGLGCKPFRGWR